MQQENRGRMRRCWDDDELANNVENSGGGFKNGDEF